jgi:hypothetical protein
VDAGSSAAAELQTPFTRLLPLPLPLLLLQPLLLLVLRDMHSGSVS